MTAHGRTVSDTGAADYPGGRVWLETPPVFEEEGVHALLHVWIVGDKCLGMSVRESADPRVGTDAAMVPHIFRG